jgi:hypothetical protein
MMCFLCRQGVLGAEVAFKVDEDSSCDMMSMVVSLRVIGSADCRVVVLP